MGQHSLLMVDLLFKFDRKNSDVLVLDIIPETSSSQILDRSKCENMLTKHVMMGKVKEAKKKQCVV